jgi:hypothetical protein
VILPFETLLHDGCAETERMRGFERRHNLSPCVCKGNDSWRESTREFKSTTLLWRSLYMGFTILKKIRSLHILFIFCHVEIKYFYFYILQKKNRRKHASVALFCIHIFVHRQLRLKCILM